jgi:hypothetical protein
VLDVENGDQPGIICNNHLRIRVSLDTTRPLIPRFNLPCQGRSSIWIGFLYEMLANYCTLCGLIGHRKSFCPAPPPGPQDRYGLSLRGYVFSSSRAFANPWCAFGYNYSVIHLMHWNTKLTFIHTEVSVYTNQTSSEFGGSTFCVYCSSHSTVVVELSPVAEAYMGSYPQQSC